MVARGPSASCYTYDFAGRMAAQVECTNGAPSCQGLTQSGGFDGANNVWFGGRQVISLGNVVVPDRLGSVRSTPGNNEKISYPPYGDEQNSPTTMDNRTKFATYYRDRTVDNQDYADQRYYNPWMGRFNSPDPSGLKAAKPSSPSSWNMYGYADGDPITFRDPTGTGLDGSDVYSLCLMNPVGCWDAGINIKLGPDSDLCGLDSFLDGAAPLSCSSDPCSGNSFLPNPGCYYQNLPAQTPPTNGNPATGPCWNWSCMPPAEAQALSDLANKPGCAQLYNGHDPGTVLIDIIGNIQYGNVSFDPLSPGVAAVTDLEYEKGAKTATIDINTYLSAANVYWNTGLANYNAVTLLHELGHVFDWEFGAASTSIVYDANPDGRPNVIAEGRNARALAKCGP